MKAQTVAASQPLVIQTERSHSQRLALIALAWLATLLCSRLPQIVLREGFGVDTSWIHWLWIGSLLAFGALSFVWTAISPLRGYFLIMLVVLVATAVLDPLVRQTTIWTSWFGSDQLAVVTLFAERVLLILTTLMVLGALLLMGLKRRQFFLVKGEMDAPALKLPDQKRTASWRVFGPVLATLLSILYVWFFAAGFGLPTGNIFVKALPFLPLALLAAAMNAFGEEMMYRAAPLSQLLPVVGAGQALLMTSIWFGLGHYYGGIPSGIAGLVFAGLLATLFGKAMLDTRGMTWPWVIHFLADAVIYTFLTLAMVAA